MPLYAYRCSHCGHDCEFLQSYDDPPHRQCPNCHQEQLKKQISAPSFTFKGSGWYKDLYGSGKADAAKPAAEAAGPKTESAAAPSTTGSAPAEKSAAPVAKPETGTS